MVLVAVFCITGTVSPVAAYDMGAHHEVNQDINKDKVKKQIWDFLIKDGYSEAAAAGVMGNWMRESGCNPTVIQGHISWDEFEVGSYGIGLAQWTYHSRQKNLFRKADEMGKPWTDLNVQLNFYKQEVQGYSFNAVGGLANYKKLTDVDRAVVVFENCYEKAGVKAMDQRKEYARDIYKKYSGSEPSTDSDSGAAAGSSKKVKVSESKAVVEEWELMGMSGTRVVYDGANVELPTSDELSAGEAYSVALLKEDILSDKNMQFMDLVRTFVIFLGLCSVVYSVIILIAYIFDRTNNIFEISLTRIVTFGRMGYSEEDALLGVEGFMGKSRVIKVSALCMCAGFLIISGAMFSWLSVLVYKLTDWGIVS